MRIRKKSGEADGAVTGVCLVTCTVFDDEGPQNIVAGEEYYIEGDADPAIFKVDGEKKRKKEPVDIFANEEEEVPK